MFQHDIQNIRHTAQEKLNLFNRRPLAYILSSILAGIFIGFGICLVFTIQSLMPDVSGTKVLMGIFFSVALSLVVIAGAELFTGNTMVMTIGLLEKTTPLKDTLRLWLICWIGNLLGSILLGFLFVQGNFTNGAVADVFVAAAIAKAEIPPLALFIRGILCNMLVCLAVWGSGRIQDGAGKILFITLCIATFIITGFEHSVANMTLMTIGLLAPSSLQLSLAAAIYNLVVVTFGNMIGGIFCVALPYWYIGQEK